MVPTCILALSLSLDREDARKVWGFQRSGSGNPIDKGNSLMYKAGASVRRRFKTPHCILQGEDNVNKADLIEKIAKDAGINKTQADSAINSVLSGVEGELKKGGRVTLVGFGTFSVGARKARTGRNPQTGKPIKIAAKKVAKFTPGAELKAAVNKKK
jgi:DNA-binding protein HU-beta